MNKSTTHNCNIVYLGLSIGANPRRVEMWKLIIQKFEKIFANWKYKHISFGRRVTLINSFLYSLPLFYLSFFKISKEVCSKLVGIQIRFLWRHGSENNKISWAKWEDVCKSMDLGGLGVTNIEVVNDVLLGRWRWNLFHRSDGAWKDVLMSMYEGWHGLLREES